MIKILKEDTLYRYYDKIINNLKGSKTLKQLGTARNMYIHHHKIVSGTIHFSSSKNRMIKSLIENKEKELG